jgi:DNA-binding transcriptional ArsR family regulator
VKIATSLKVFAALSDSTRQQLIDWLASEETGTATEFATRLPISRQAVARHLSELEAAGLVRGARLGKEHRYSLDPGPLVDAMQWLAARASRWDATLEALVQHLSTDGQQSEDPADD